MPLTEAQVQNAQASQHAAAHASTKQTRLIAGPGTGKSSSIEERVHWLINQGVDPASIFVVSFTKAAARDLKSRILLFSPNDASLAASVSVTTLHSLALSSLRKAQLLSAYPVEPIVMDEWETKEIFDAEFGASNSTSSTIRQEQIRRFLEAYWSTDTWDHPNYVQPDPPITGAEKDAFIAFHSTRSQVYACVLPGEIVRLCVKNIEAGTIDPVDLLGMKHLIVDEFQDLNPLDLRLVEEIEKRGVCVFAAGDDDQSIYSFRFASPHGIQYFTDKYPSCGQYMLTECFRCTSEIVRCAQELIRANPGPNRIAKTLDSLYAQSVPPVPGLVFRWKFTSDTKEANAIAQSCKDLIASGLKARDILILLSNKKRLLPKLINALNHENVAFESPKEDSFYDTESGRFILGVLRVTCNKIDYIAHRVILGLFPGVGVGTCNKIAEKVTTNNLNYRDIFYNLLPDRLFNTRETGAISKASGLFASINNWQPEDMLSQRQEEIRSIIDTVFGANSSLQWDQFISTLPDDILLQELRDFMYADTDEQQAMVLNEVYTRLAIQPPSNILPPKVRVMTMHGAKGLSAHVVFIPGLEEDLLPGGFRRPYAGLVAEAARMLYVSITRARVACIASFATTRSVFGQIKTVAPSRFVSNLGGSFVAAPSGLSTVEVASILNMDGNL